MNNKLMQELNLEDDFLFAKVMADPIICKKGYREDIRYRNKIYNHTTGTKSNRLIVR